MASFHVIQYFSRLLCYDVMQAIALHNYFLVYFYVIRIMFSIILKSGQESIIFEKVCFSPQNKPPIDND